jgi:E3 ubiquitin-protein ligase UBR7
MEQSSTHEEIISCGDIIKNINKEIVIASKLDGHKDLKICSYNKGYITQELFACRTCYKEKAEMAALCISCSLHCHEDHDLIHLYFKRNFRCDCGNSKFGKYIINLDIPCSIQTEKEYENKENIYNHNFIGKYCSCDGEDDEEEDMIQCIVCEDWYHNKHLNLDVV